MTNKEQGLMLIAIGIIMTRHDVDGISAQLRKYDAERLAILVGRGINTERATLLRDSEPEPLL